MLYLVITVITLIVGLYMIPNETKGFLKWGKNGVVGVAKDAKAIRNKSLARQANDPLVKEATNKWLNEEIIDTTKYRREATTREWQSKKALVEARAKEEEALRDFQ